MDKLKSEDLLGIKDFVKTETEKMDASKEMFLQFGICCSLATLMVSPYFDIIVVFFIAVYMILTVTLITCFDHYKAMLDKLEETELDGSELGI